jgi:hypothetical protein
VVRTVMHRAAVVQSCGAAHDQRRPPATPACSDRAPGALPGTRCYSSACSLRDKVGSLLRAQRVGVHDEVVVRRQLGLDAVETA